MKKKLRAIVLVHLAGCFGPLAAEGEAALRPAGRVQEHALGDDSDWDRCEELERWERFEDGAVEITGAATRKLAPMPGHASPMIQEAATGLVPSEHFLGMTETLAIMNQLAYRRGQDYRFGHQITYTEALAGWEMHNVSARRGLTSSTWINANDPNAGFVAYNQGLNTVAIVMHGSINRADWQTNVQAVPQRYDAVTMANGQKVAMVGRGHMGFMNKFLSCMPQIQQHLDRILGAMAPEQLASLKIYVSGHSQGAALAQQIGVATCQHLRGLIPDFNNRKQNTVHVWLLSAPGSLDRTAKAFAEAVVGKRNMLVQNTWLDPVPNGGITTDGTRFESAGTQAMQSSLEALGRAGLAHAKAVKAHNDNGDPEGWSGALAPILDPAGAARFAIAAQHMGTDNVNYRGVGHSFAFDPDMVVKDLEGLNACLQAAYDHEQGRLRAAKTQTWAQWFKSRFLGY